VTAKDDRTDIFGIPYEPPERDEAVAQYQRGSMHKLQIADWHGAEFERLEDELTTADFFDFDTERFLPAQARGRRAHPTSRGIRRDRMRRRASLRRGESRSRVPVGVELGLPARRRGRAGSEVILQSVVGDTNDGTRFDVCTIRTDGSLPGHCTFGKFDFFPDWQPL
jgi:hypothetical protein